MHHGRVVDGCDAQGRVEARGGGPAYQEGNVQARLLQLGSHVHHLLQRGSDEAAEANHVHLPVHGAPHDVFGGHHDSQVYDFIAIAGHHHGDDVLADVVHVALHRGQQHTPRGSGSPGLLRLDDGLEDGHGLLHRAGGLHHLREEHLARAEEVAHPVHPCHQGAFDDVHGAGILLQCLGQIRFQVIADATDPNQAITCNAYLQGILSPALAELQAASPSGTALNLHTRLLYNPQMRSAYNFVPGVMGLILMLICAMMTSISIVREKETGTMEVLLVSPVPPLFVILSKAVPYFLLSILNLTTILLLSVFVLHVPIAGSLTALSGVSLLFIFVSLSLGLLISCVTRTQVAALLISAMLLMMPTILLSGMIFPVESMPLILQGFSCLIPARWYISVVRKLMIEGVPFACVWQETCILFLMGTILIGITTRKFKNRLE